MPATYQRIASTTLSSPAATITLSSIPSTYTDIRLVFYVVATSISTNIQCQFNSDTGTNYSNTWLAGNGTAASSGRNTSATNIQFTDLTATSTTIPLMFTMDIFSYAGSTNKTVLGSSFQNYGSTGSTTMQVAMWNNTSAITSILLKTSGAPTFSTGSTVAIYGLKAA